MFDQILERKIKMGSYQYKTVAIVGLIDFIDGLEYLFLSILISILRKEWDLSDSQLAFFSSAYFFGIVIGNLSCAFFADKFGRKLSLNFFMFFQFIVVLITAFAQNYVQMCFLRLAYGAIFGFTMPLSYVITSEVVLAQERGRIGMFIAVLYQFGKIYFVLLCYIFLDDYQSGNWRELILFNCIPVFICFLGTVFFVVESPRYILAHERYTEAFAAINSAIKENSGQDLVNQQEKDVLIWEFKQGLKHEFDNKGIKQLFSENYLEITLKLWFILILVNILNTTFYLLMPFLFQQSQKGFSALLYVSIGELIIILIIYTFIDNQSFGGRRQILIVSTTLLTLLHFSLFQWKEAILVVSLTLMKLLCRGIFVLSYILATESYSSVQRTIGASTAQCVGKIAASISPYMIFPIYFYSSYLPFLINGFLSAIMIYLTWSYPVELTRKRLDHIK